MKRRDLLRISALTGMSGVMPSSFRRFLFAEAPEPQRSNHTRYLFLDSRVIAKREGVTLTLGSVKKDDRNPLFGQDKPWEVRFDNMYPNVVFDDSEGMYKCWYDTFLSDQAQSSTPPELRPFHSYGEVLSYSAPREEGICYATSKDGLTWNKPELGLVDFNGSRRNNILFRKEASGSRTGAGVIRDVTEIDPLRRYKMFFWDAGPNAMSTSFSQDGLHWSEPHLSPEIGSDGDTHNNLFRGPNGRWVGITRLRNTLRERVVGRTESTDLAHWTSSVEILGASQSWRQTYEMLVFRHANIYLGLLAILNEDGDGDTVDCELAWSPDTIRWERICPGTPLIQRGSPGSHDGMCIYPGAYPLKLQKEIRLYYCGSNGKHTGYRDGSFCLARLRADGYASLASAASARGIVETELIECTGTQLCLTADIASGRVQVGIIDVRGYEVGDCIPQTTDCTDQPIQWNGRNDVSPFLGKYIRLRFVLSGAKLYSFSFA